MHRRERSLLESSAPIAVHWQQFDGPEELVSKFSKRMGLFIARIVKVLIVL
jgi:hypothetical protein